MNGLLPGLAVTVGLCAFVLALARHSLRDFSFSRLEEVCRARNRPARFSLIHRWHDQAFLVAEIAFCLTAGLMSVLLVEWLLPETWPKSDARAWATLVLEGFGLIAGLLLALVALPWSLSQVAGERFLFWLWPLLHVLLTVAAPLRGLVRRLDVLTHRLSGIPERNNEDGAQITEELQSVIDEGQREGQLDSEARSMIQRVIALQEDDAASVMRPRTSMRSISVDCSLLEAREKLLEFGHSRVPVVGENSDDIIGILYAKDLLQYLGTDGSQSASLRDIVREPFYVPETTGIDKLLELMKRRKVHLAIVIDEYSGVAGLVTMEDILEEIVGDIHDEYDPEEDTGIRLVSDGVIEVDSEVHIDDLNEQFEFDLPEDGDFETIGGFVYDHFGRIPVSGESFTWKAVHLTVLQATPRRIRTLRLQADPSLVSSHASGEDSQTS
ncbi:MAG: HlyC/CorC family transporter [Planctomycetaceae bacterium]|nr:HlyC/CorC family transporter [Planctomycetaceae bacterium]